jgi:hypothetical protein
MFWDIPGSKPVWLSGAFSQRKITANSGGREAKVVFDRPYLAIKEQNTAIGWVEVLGAGFGNDTGSVIGLRNYLPYKGSDWPFREIIWPSIANY